MIIFLPVDLTRVNVFLLSPVNHFLLFGIKIGKTLTE